MQREISTEEKHGSEGTQHDHGHADHVHQEPQVAAPGYTCPMHPEVRQAGPGQCPKCGMFLEPVGASSAHAHGHVNSADHQRHEHQSHQDHHIAPGRRSASAQSAVVKAVKDAEYTCPMHPQIRQVGPGNCPICGMALEPVIATGEAGESPELRDMTRRFWIGLALTVPVFFLEMGRRQWAISSGHRWCRPVLPR